jgi:hypothetical protein
LPEAFVCGDEAFSLATIRRPATLCNDPLGKRKDFSGDLGLTLIAGLVEHGQELISKPACWRLLDRRKTHERFPACETFPSL